MLKFKKFSDNILIMGVNKINIHDIRMINKDASYEDKIRWLVQAIGIKSGRDIEGTTEKIFVKILEINREKEGFTLEEIAEALHIPKSTAFYHLERMIEHGIITKDKEYHLKAPTLKDTIEELKLEFDRMIERIRRIAEEIDKDMY